MIEKEFVFHDRIDLSFFVGFIKGGDVEITELCLDEQRRK